MAKISCLFFSKIYIQLDFESEKFWNNIEISFSAPKLQLYAKILKIRVVKIAKSDKKTLCREGGLGQNSQLSWYTLTNEVIQ